MTGSALRKSFRQVLASNSERRTGHIERAICNTALKAVRQTDGMVPYLDHAIGLFNSYADEIDDKYGKGFFEVRLIIKRENAFTFKFMLLRRGPLSLFVPLRPTPPRKTYKAKPGLPAGMDGDWWARPSIRLDYVMATDPNPVYRWMSDLLFMGAINEQELKRQSSARDGFWNRVLRKRKWAIAQKRAVVMREINLDLKEDQQRQKTRTERRDIMTRREKLERLIREAPGNEDIAVGWPHGWRVSPTDPKGTGMFVPLSRRQAQNVPGKDEDDDGGKVDPE